MISSLRLFPVLALMAACAPQPEPLPAHPPPIGPPVDVTPGLNEKEPDTCKAAPLMVHLGQPVGALQAAVAATGQKLRVIGPGDIVSQEYDSFRVDALVDGAGLVTRITCG